MTNYSLTLPAYSIGDRVYEEIDRICAPYGRRAVIIGGEKALAAAEPSMRAAMKTIFAPESILFGGEASEENVERLSSILDSCQYDMIFAVGGGKAIDTCKALAEKLNKPVFSFPTIASTCAATTAVAIMYHPDGSFSHPFFISRPPQHAFINTSVIACAPEKYMWAGMGDTYAKYYESTVSSRGETLIHYHELGVTVSRMCVEPVFRWGAAALQANRRGEASFELEQVVLAITVTTGIASIFLTNEHIIDYNTGLAHGIFYSLTSNPEIEENHLHGEVVGFGVLLLLLCDGQDDEFRRLYSFMKSVGLPTSPRDIGLTDKDVAELLPAAAAMPDVAHNPYKVTPEMLSKAFDELCRINRRYDRDKEVRNEV